MHRKTPTFIHFLRAFLQAITAWTSRAARLVTTDVRRLRDTRLGPLMATASGRNTMAGLAVIGVVTAGLVAGSVSSPVASKSTALASSTQRDTAHSSRSAGRDAAKPAKPGKGSGSAAKQKSKPQKPKPWTNPMPGVSLSSCFGPRWGTEHKGIDFAGKAGTTIRSVGAGKVLGAGWLYTGYGKSVMISHGNGYFTHYAHASKVLVHEGQRVKPGQPIALEGSTGNSTGPHLHFEVHHGLWNQVNPASWLRAHGVPSKC